MSAEAQTLLPTIADAEPLAEVQVQSFNHTYKQILPSDYLDEMDKEEIKDIFVARMQDSDKHLVIAKIQGKVIGYGYFTDQRMPELPYTAEIIELYVHPDFHGQGVGKKLFRHMTALLSGMSHHSFNVWVLAANKNACLFYEGMGGQKLIEGEIYWPGIEDKTFNAACYYWANAG